MIFNRVEISLKTKGFAHEIGLGLVYFSCGNKYSVYSTQGLPSFLANKKWSLIVCKISFLPTIQPYLAQRNLVLQSL